MPYGKHKGIISGENFIKVQSLLKVNESMRYKNGKCTQSLLSGTIVCGECGSYMRPKTSTRELPNGNRRFHYMCELKDKSRKCKCQAENIDGNLADEMVLKFIKEMIAPTSSLCEELKKVVATFEYNNNDAKEKIKQLNSRYNKNLSEINSLIDKIKYVDVELMGDITNEIKRLKEINKEIKIEMAQNDLEEGFGKKDYAKLMLDIIAEYRENFDSLDYKAKRELMKLIINKVEAKGKNIVIHLFGSENEKIVKSVPFFPKGEY